MFRLWLNRTTEITEITEITGKTFCFGLGVLGAVLFSAHVPRSIPPA